MQVRISINITRLKVARQAGLCNIWFEHQSIEEEAIDFNCHAFQRRDRAVGHRRLRLHFHSRPREARWYRRHPRPMMIFLVVPFFSRVISVGAAQSFHGEKWPTTGGWRYTSPGPGPTEWADGQTHNENVECPAERDMKTSLRNGNGQNTGSGPIWTVSDWLRTTSCVLSSSESAPSPGLRRVGASPSERNSFRGCVFIEFTRLILDRKLFATLFTRFVVNREK